MKAVALRTMRVLDSSKAEVFYRLFVFSGAAILAVTGLAKVWTAVGSARALTLIDPVTGLQFGHLLLAVGLLELAIAAACLFWQSQRLPLSLIAWLATSFLVYRLGLWWMGWHKPCNCLGNLSDALHISPTAADNIMKLVLAYLLVGSYAALWCRWRGAHEPPSHTRLAAVIHPGSLPGCCPPSEKEGVGA